MRAERSGCRGRRNRGIAVDPLLCRVEADPAGYRRQRRELLPLRMKWRPLQLRHVSEKLFDQQGQEAIAVAAYLPVIGRENRLGRDGADGSGARYQVRIILRGKLCRQILIAQWLVG